MAFNYETATEEEFAEYCSRSNPNRTILSEMEGGHSIIKIPRNAVIKCGFGITRDEAENQKRAYELIDPTIIRVPFVYRYVKFKNVGYLVMEFINGEPLHTFEDPKTCTSITKALSHFAQIRADQPGPLGSGLAYGLLWISCDLISPSSIVDIEEYYNTRQLQRHKKLNLENFPLSLCHLDIVPRNILKLKDESLCLLDWASAGFYPRFFEICTLRINCWNSKVLNVMEQEHMDEREVTQAKLLEHAYYLGEKYAYLPASLRKKKKTAGVLCSCCCG